jgi:hypothetical protein
MSKKLIIGLGDSFTQGVGAYSDKTWKANNNKIDVSVNSKELLAEQFEGSWVNQLCQTYLKGWTPVNMGHAGIGNRGIVKQLYIQDRHIKNADEVIVILLLSGLERFDFVRKDYKGKERLSFQAMWPNPQDENATHPELWKAYTDDIYSEKFIAVELILNILEAQTYCKAHGYKFIFASAFDERANKTWLLKTLCGMLPMLEPENKSLIEQIDWNNYLYPKGYNSFIEYLLRLDGQSRFAQGGWWKYYTNLPAPSEYITNCAHPTRKGHEVIANELYNFIKTNV